MVSLSKCAISILLIISLLIVAKVEAINSDGKVPGKTGKTLKAAESVAEDLSSNTNDGRSRVKRQYGGYDPYYDRRRPYPYPPIVFGGIGLGGFGGYGYGRDFGGRGFEGRGFSGRGFGGRGFGGRGIGGRGGIGGFGGGRGGGRG